MSIKLKDQNNNEIFIAGTNSEDFINDKVLRNDKTWSSNKIVEELYPTFQKEGNPIICYPVENYPLNVKATFSPKQAGTSDPSPENIRPISGWDEVTVTRYGKNLVGADSHTKAYGAYRGVDFTGLLNVNLRLQTNLKKGKEIPVNTSFGFVHIGRKGNTYASWAINNGVLLSQDLIDSAKSEDEMFICGCYPNTEQSWDSIFDVCDIMVCVEDASGPSAPYEPYQGDTSTLTLPETIYGGTVDAVTGVGSKTWGYIASYNGESLPGEWISDRDVYAPGTTPTTGAQVAYKLAIPEPFQASGNQALPAVAGLNTVYTDGDSLIISGKEDIKYTINQITSNIQNINQIQEINNILLGVE